MSTSVEALTFTAHDFPPSPLLKVYGASLVLPSIILVKDVPKPAYPSDGEPCVRIVMVGGTEATLSFNSWSNARDAHAVILDAVQKWHIIASGLVTEGILDNA